MSNFFSNLKTKIQSILPNKGEKKRVKTPTVLQMEAVECGAACLGIILGYHGYIAPLEELRLACGVSRDGSKASNMLKAARRYGLVAKGFRANPKILKTLELPLIVHWNFNHFLVVEGFDNDKYYLNDPATGPRTVSEEEFDQSFTGVALTFSKGENFEKGGRKRNLFEILWPRLQGSERALGYVFLVSLALVIPGLLIPTFSRVFVDFVLVRRLDSWLWPLLIGLLLTAVMRMALTWLQQRYLLRLETKLAVVNSGRLFWHMLRLPIEFFTQRSAGEVGSRLDMNDRVAQLLSGQLATALLNIVLLVFYALLMFQYSVVLTLVGIGMVAINLVTLRYISRKRVDINQRLIREQGHMYATAATGLQSIETLKATGAESDFFTRWSGYQAKAINAEQELGVFNQIVTVIPTFLSTTTTVAILIIGGYSVMNGVMTIGMLVAFQSLMESFLAPVNQLVDLGGQLQEIEGTLTRLEDVLQYPPDEQVKIVEQPTAEIREKLSGAVEIRGLSFGYSRLEPPLIENFNLTLEPGSRVALVGGSGSGKSTIAKLLVGLYQPWEGEIFFDHQRREEIPRSILNTSLAFVDQDIFLFEDTIKGNLTMWDINIPEEDVIQAAKDAYIHSVIAGRANGYNAPVEEGGRNFSGGQRQRLEIARALVNSPTVLVLDEATSALDPLAEQIIDGNLRRRGCTCIIVAHRLSTIRDCDEIIVLERGKVVERGTHNQLWQKRGSYFRLIQAEAPESEMRVERLLEALYE